MKPTYNTWIRKKKIGIFCLVLVGLLTASVCLWRVSWVYTLILLLLAVPFMYLVYVLARTYYLFSATGGGFQPKIHGLIVDAISTKKGKLLDIGAGSGALVNMALKKLPGLHATGVDYWGQDWDYSKGLCASNAKLEGVGDRLELVKSSASKLPFKDASFDTVISCLTFHEVKDETDKTKVLQEALRVLKDGGQFVFMDLFLNERVFGDMEALTKSLHVSKLETAKLSELITLPQILLSTKSLGHAVLIKGTK